MCFIILVTDKQVCKRQTGSVTTIRDSRSAIVFSDEFTGNILIVTCSVYYNIMVVDTLPVLWAVAKCVIKH